MSKDLRSRAANWVKRAKSSIGICYSLAMIFLIAKWLIQVNDVFEFPFLLSVIAGTILWLRKSASTSTLKFLASIYPGIATVVILFCKDRIFENTNTGVEYLKHFIGAEYDQAVILKQNSYSVDYVTTIYLISVICWTFIYVFFVSNESTANTTRNNELKSAIIRAPNPELFGGYLLLYKKMNWFVNGLHALERVGTLKDYDVFLQSILRHICEVTKFYTKSSDSMYSANIMIYVPNNTVNKSHLNYFKTSDGNKDGWLHFNGYCISEFRGILHGPLNLALPNMRIDDGKAEERVPCLTLGLLRSDELENGKLKRLPGACSAAIEGNALIEDVLKMEEQFRVLGQDEYLRSHRFFNKEGKNIRSFVSISIPWREDIQNEFKDSNAEEEGSASIDDIDNQTPTEGSKVQPEIPDEQPPIIGVLNINSNNAFVLGTDREYHKTFYSLILPILCQISPFLVRYRELYLQEIEQEKDFQRL